MILGSDAWLIGMTYRLLLFNQLSPQILSPRTAIIKYFFNNNASMTDNLVQELSGEEAIEMLESVFEEKGATGFGFRMAPSRGL